MPLNLASWLFLFILPLEKSTHTHTLIFWLVIFWTVNITVSHMWTKWYKARTSVLFWLRKIQFTCWVRDFLNSICCVVHFWPSQVGFIQTLSEGEIKNGKSLLKGRPMVLMTWHFYIHTQYLWLISKKCQGIQFTVAHESDFLVLFGFLITFPKEM